MCFHCMGVSLLILPPCHLVRRGVLSGAVDFFAPWVHSECIFTNHSLTWHKFWRHCHGGLLCSTTMMWCFRCFHPWKLWRGGGDGDCGMAMLKMSASYFSAAFCFPPSCRMGLDGAGF